MNAVPPQVPRFLAAFQRYLIVGHIEPDGDCVASAVALARYLTRSGRRAVLLDAGPFDRPEIASFQSLFQTTAPPAERGTAAVVVDCSTEDRLGPLAEAVRGLPLLVIDHHAAGRPFGTERWVEPAAPCVSWMVQRLLESLGEPLPAEDAELLLFGLGTDTGYFRHLGEGSGAIFEAAARLVHAGASPQRVFRRIHSGWNLARVRLLAAALGRAELLLAGRVLCTWWTLADLREAGASYARGSDEVYRLLQYVQTAEVVVFLREETTGRVSVGLRSAGGADVGALALALGGGGHPQAAGCTLQGSLGEVRNTVLAAVERFLPPTAASATLPAGLPR